MAHDNYEMKDGNLSLYLRDIARYKPLKPAEERELAPKIRGGEGKALQKLVKCNLRFVVSVARNYQNQGLPLTDLINEGNLGLVRAAYRFDEKKNFKFISYAVWWIRQGILQGLAEQSRIVKVPLNKVATIHKIGKERIKFEQEYKRPAGTEELAKKVGCYETDVIDTELRGSRRHTSLDTSAQSKLYDIIYDEEQEKTDDEVMKEALREGIDKVLEEITSKERKVIELYFGIGDDHNYTLDEIKDKFGVTRERVRQIKEKALRKLKRSKRAKDLRHSHSLY